MKLVRALFFIAAQCNFIIYVRHLFGVDNSIADSLSRSLMARFRLLAPGADSEPTPVVKRDLLNF